MVMIWSTQVRVFIYLLYYFLLIILLALEVRGIFCSFVAMNAFLPWWCSENLWKMKRWFGKPFAYEDSPAVEAGLSPSLRIFMTWLCKALSSTVWSPVWAFPGQELGLEVSPDHRQNKVSCDPVIFRRTSMCLKFVISGGNVILKDDSLGSSCVSCSW